MLRLNSNLLYRCSRGNNASGTLIVKALKPLNLKKDSGLLTGLLTHLIVRYALGLDSLRSPLSFIESRQRRSFPLVTQLKTLTQLCFQPACHPVNYRYGKPAFYRAEKIIGIFQPYKSCYKIGLKTPS